MDQNNVRRGFYRLDYMAIRGTNAFSPPSKPDVHVTWEEDIILQGINPEPVNSRGCLGLNKKDFAKVVALMVVFLSSDFFYFNLRILTFEFFHLLVHTTRHLKWFI